MTTAAGGNVTIEAQLRTRGRFRLDKRSRSFPPLRLNLKKKQTEGTEFEEQDKLKIVSPCRPNRDSYEQLVLNEYLVYRTFAMITATSFQVRLARITYVDESGDDDPFTRLAFFIENDDALAARVGMGFEVFDIPEDKNLPLSVFEPTASQTMAVFQYMIGNTDWSEVAGHNVEVLSISGIAVPVPYDFNFSGIVEAPYSVPDPSLGIKRVQDRMYRGWCRSNLDPEPILERFRAAETDIMALYRDFPYLEDGERNRSMLYLEDFFKDIATPQRANRRFLRHFQQLPTLGSLLPLSVHGPREHGGNGGSRAWVDVRIVPSLLRLYRRCCGIDRAPVIANDPSASTRGKCHPRFHVLPFTP